MISVRIFRRLLSVLALIAFVIQAQARQISHIQRPDNTEAQYMRLYQAERIDYTLIAQDGPVQTNSLVVWKVLSTNLVSRWWSVTGTVTDADLGQVDFTVHPQLSNVPSSNYTGYVVTYTDTNDYTVLSRQEITVRGSTASTMFDEVTPLTMEQGSW